MSEQNSIFDRSNEPLTDQPQNRNVQQVNSDVMPSNDVDLDATDMQILKRRRPDSSVKRASTMQSRASVQKPRVTVQQSDVSKSANGQNNDRAATRQFSIPPKVINPRVSVHDSNQPQPKRPAPSQTAISKDPSGQNTRQIPTEAFLKSQQQYRRQATSSVRHSPSQVSLPTQTIIQSAQNTRPHIDASRSATRQFSTVPPVRQSSNRSAPRMQEIGTNQGKSQTGISRTPPSRTTPKSSDTRAIQIQRNNAVRQRNMIDERPDYDEYATEPAEERNGVLSSVVKAIIYIAFVLIVSSVLSYLGITVCNDAFAFVKDDTEHEVVIPQNATIDDVSSILKENDIIRYPFFFKLYSQMRKDSGNYVAGTYIVSSNTNYDDLLSAFKEKVKPREEIQLTIPEGYTVDEIINLFLENGIGTREKFVDVIQNYDFDFWFIDELEETEHPGRTYRLEGYLFPDTYRFYSDSNEETVIYKMLVRFNELYTDEFRAHADELGYTTDQIITLASMIQMEAKFSSEYGAISSVFHNRLNHPSGETGGRLESDATIQYILSERHVELSQSDLDLDSPYNTYKYAGLPIGPISNPCYAAIIYALYPTDTDYYYFVAQPNGYSLFAKTYEEHRQNKLAVQR